MKSTIKVLKELRQNLVVTHRLALNELLTENAESFFGVVWLWLNPTIQIIIYAFVYGYGIRNSRPVRGHEFLYWLISGFVAWMYISGTVTKAARSIVRKMGLITKMRFPVSITPAIDVLSGLYVHLMMLITVIIILLVFGDYKITKYYWYLPYFTFAMVALLYSISIFNSALTTVVRDFRHVVYNVMRTMFFITPVIFPMDGAAKFMQLVMKLNPFTYILEGYRDALIYGQRTTFMSYRWGMYYWALVIVFLIIGSMLHVHMRENLLDYK